jgi:hypothetical protein
LQERSEETEETAGPDRTEEETDDRQGSASEDTESAEQEYTPEETEPAAQEGTAGESEASAQEGTVGEAEAPVPDGTAEHAESVTQDRNPEEAAASGQMNPDLDGELTVFTEEPIAETVIPAQDGGPDTDNDGLFAGYVNRELALDENLRFDTGNTDNAARRLMKSIASNRLTGNNRIIYDILLNRVNGVQGEFQSYSVVGGYAHPINKSGSLRLEYELGLGLISTDYVKYWWDGFDYTLIAPSPQSWRTNWWGPTKLSVSLVYYLKIRSKVGGRE